MNKVKKKSDPTYVIIWLGEKEGKGSRTLPTAIQETVSGTLSKKCLFEKVFLCFAELAVRRIYPYS